ncbi:Histidine kinase [Saliniradius amylolyticus]|uniref:histidine kinase n=1 Tax=Saliniradius amylolyticus TaxID=2183582 RepID=A0A2S2E1N6_9ALTE|nr:ATP-binding protein [Saliniradius amylolyticus]AWL11548.1 Histidine kinase [Saliniradius amylolyticus]
MKFQFLRLYILSAVILIGLVLSFGQLYNRIFFPQHEPAYVIPMHDLQALVTDSSKVSRLTRSQLALPQQLSDALQKNGTLSVNDHGSDYIYVLDPEQGSEDSVVYQLGPLQLIKDNEESHGFFIAFYSLLAVSLFLLFRPLFSDLVKLQRTAINFGQSPRAMPVMTRKNSSIYPLAKSFSDMSQKVTRFLSLHTDLSRIISHEIRTPLTRIRLALSLVDSIPKQEELHIHKSLDEIESRLEQYLNFARIENQFTALELTDCDSTELVQAEVDKFKFYGYLAFDLNIQIKRMPCDPNCFCIALQNLLVNASKHARKHIKVELYQHKQDYVLKVSDDGPGLPKTANSLIEPFSQGSETPLSSGYGLGLYIVHRIAHWHGGHLQLGNNPTLGGAEITFQWQAPSETVTS